MNTEDLHNKSAAELQKLLLEQREKLRKLNFRLASGKVQDTSAMRKARKNIARILTNLNRKDA